MKTKAEIIRFDLGDAIVADLDRTFGAGNWEDAIAGCVNISCGTAEYFAAALISFGPVSMTLYDLSAKDICLLLAILADSGMGTHPGRIEVALDGSGTYLVPVYHGIQSFQKAGEIAATQIRIVCEANRDLTQPGVWEILEQVKAWRTKLLEYGHTMGMAQVPGYLLPGVIWALCEDTYSQYVYRYVAWHISQNKFAVEGKDGEE